MNHIILASHSKLAEGMRETVRFFKADAQLDVIEQTQGDTNFEERFCRLIEENQGKNIVVFTDLYGGSVNQVAFRTLARHKYWLVTGMNLVVLLEVCFATEDVDQEMLETAIEAARSSLCLMNLKLPQAGEDDED